MARIFSPKYLDMKLGAFSHYIINMIMILIRTKIV